jgi:hypothetical protein
MKDTKAELLKLGRLIELERAAEARVREMRDKVRAFTGKGFYNSSSTHADGTICLCVKLEVYLRLFPDATPKLESFDWTEEHYSRLHYPMKCVGEFKPAQNLWIEAWSEKIEVSPESPVAAATTTEASA